MHVYGRCAAAWFGSFCCKVSAQCYNQLIRRDGRSSKKISISASIEKPHDTSHYLKIMHKIIRRYHSTDIQCDVTI